MENPVFADNENIPLATHHDTKQDHNEDYDSL